MIRDGHIGHRETIALLVLYTTAKTFLSFPQEMVRIGSTAAWQIPLLSGIWSYLIIYLLTRLYDYAENENIIQLGFRVGGRVFGFIAALCYTLFFIALASLVLREFTETVVATVLPGTPVSAVAIPFMFSILYIAYRGSETFTRVAFVFAPIVLVGIIAIFALNLNWMHPSFLLPILGPGLGKIVDASVFRISSYSELILIGFLFGSFRSKGSFRKTCIWSLILSTILLTAVIVVYLMLFPAESSMKLPYPMFQISRMIYLGRFLQRVESVFIFLWVGTAVIHVGASVWAASYTLAEGMRLPMYKPLLIPMSLLIYACSFIPNNFPEVASWDIGIFRNWAGFFTLGNLLILFGIVMIRRKRGRTA
jgi:spore germination protein KB